ncbi:amino acid transporter [Streptomyces spiroverticillatus]
MASALAGLLNLVPRYLPRYGMAPEWTRAVRPLVLLFFAIAVVITLWFNADVDAQSGAYATGVLVLMLSASFASTVAARRGGHRAASVGFGVITAVFAYTLVTNVVERPDGIKIATLFILGILLTSFASRVHRAFELRAATVTFDETALRLIDAAAAEGPLRVIANEPEEHSTREYRAKEYSQREQTHIPDGRPVLFLEVFVSDSSDFTTDLTVHGDEKHGARRLRVQGAGVPNTIAAVLMQLRERTGQVPHVYFNWTEGHPLGHLIRFLIFGDGEVAPVTREVLRRAEPDMARRPRVHVG